MPLILNRALYFLNDFKFYLLFLFLSLLTGLILLLLKRNRLILLLVAIGYTLVAVFCIGEIYFRYVYDQSDGLGFIKVNRKWHQRHVVFNNYFRRDRQFILDKSPGEFRIGVIGDSTTFGAGIEDPATRFSDLLETQLRADGYNVSVYNLGVSGTGSEDQAKDFANFKHLNFDLLVWQYFLNDVNPPDSGEGNRIIITNKDKFIPPPVIKWLTDRSFLADWLYWRLSAKYNRTFTDLLAADLNAYADTAILSRHQTVIKKFLAQTKANHLPVVVILFPFLYQTPLIGKADVVYDQMLDFFASQPVAAAINLKSILRVYPARQLMASRFDSHPNELVHSLAADQLYQVVKALLP